MTYSIVARDAETGELGVAVQSRAFNTGAAHDYTPPGGTGVGVRTLVGLCEDLAR